MGLFDGTPLEHLVTCTTCGSLAKECRCAAEAAAANELPLDPTKQRFDVRTERRAKGKLVTVVQGIQGTPRQLQMFLKSIKDHCGTGGTVVENGLELQGDQVERLRKWLSTDGVGSKK